jgi:di/tricarboxylate transporter
MSTTATGSNPGGGFHDPSLGGLVNAVKETFFQRYGIVFGVIALIVICLMPTPEGLPVAGKRMLAILLFSVIVWMTDSISYPVSAVVITALMAFLVGMSPNVADPKAIYGTGKGL